MSRIRLTLTILSLATLMFAWQCAVWAQKKEPAKGSARLEFDVVHSIDAKYHGDTAAHTGRIGNVTERPSIALGDGVYAFDGHTRVGKVTAIEWDRSKQSIEVEIAPEPDHRIAVGDRLWVWLHSEHAEAKPETKEKS
jgi:hypothetical protein